MAPRPKPIEHHEASGAYEKDPQRRPKNPPPKVDGWPEPPEDFSTDELNWWHSLCDRLEQKNVLCKTNREALEGFIAAYAMFHAARRELRAGNWMMTITTDKGNEIQAPIVGVLNKSNLLLHKWCIEFGLTPASRGKVSVENQEEAEPEFEL